MVGDRITSVLGRCFQDLFNIARKVVVLLSSSFSSVHYTTLRMHYMDPVILILY